MNLDALKELKQQADAATEPTRELLHSVALLAEQMSVRPSAAWWGDIHRWLEARALDQVALALVERLLPGWEEFTGYSPSHDGGNGCAYCTLESDATTRFGAVAPTRASAIVRTLLAALIAQAEAA